MWCKRTAQKGDETSSLFSHTKYSSYDLQSNPSASRLPTSLLISCNVLSALSPIKMAKTRNTSTTNAKTAELNEGNSNATTTATLKNIEIGMISRSIVSTTISALSSFLFLSISRLCIITIHNPSCLDRPA